MDERKKRTEFYVKVQCPYCKTGQFTRLKEGFNIVACDIDDYQGCDKYFTVQARIKIDTEIYKMEKVK